MKYNNINSNLNPLDDELNKKHAQYEEFRDNLSNESIFSKKPQGYVTLKNDFPVIDQEDWAVRTNYYEQLKEVIPQQDLKALSDGIHECKTGFKTEDWSGNFSIAAVKTGKIKRIKVTKQTDWYEHLMANLNVKYPCYLSKNNLYVISVNGFKLPVLKDWVNLYQSDLENGSTGTTNFAIEESKNNALAISQNIETQMNQLNLADSFDVPELARMKEEFEVKKAELESMLKEMYQKQAAIREQLQHEIELNQQKLFVKSADLYALEYRLGFPVEFKQLLQGTQAELETPVSIHQKVYFLDEDLPRISLLTNIPEVKSVEELLSSSPAALNYLVPSKKGISFVKMSRNNKDYKVINKAQELLAAQQKTRYFVGFETDGKIFYLNKKLGGSYSYGYYKHYQISQFETYAKDENIFVVLTDLPVQVYTSKTIAEKLRKEMLNVEKTFSFNGETYEKPEWRMFEFSEEEVSKYHKHISLEEMKNGKG